MHVKIVSDGIVANTKIINVDTMEELRNVTKITWCADGCGGWNGESYY